MGKSTLNIKLPQAHAASRLRDPRTGLSAQREVSLRRPVPGPATRAGPLGASAWLWMLDPHEPVTAFRLVWTLRDYTEQSNINSEGGAEPRARVSPATELVLWLLFSGGGVSYLGNQYT